MRVCFSCVAAHGHVEPLLPLAYALRDAGHSVAFATGPAVAPHGFPLLPAGLDEDARSARCAPYRRASATLPPADRRPFVFTRVFALVDAPVKLPELLAAARAWRPQLIVHDVCDLAAPAAAAALDVPSVAHSLGPPVPPAILAEAVPLVATLWESVGLAPAPLCGLTRTLYIDPCPPSLRQEPFPDVPLARLRPVSAGRRAAPGDRGRTIYVTLGTVFNDPAVMRVLLAGVSTEDWDVIATIGADRDPTELGPQPANVHVRRYVAQRRVLPHCAAVVSHGGCGTMLGALAHGLPLLIVPQGADQFENAQRCEAAGVGRSLAPERLSAAAVREHLGALLADPGYARSAQRVAAEIAAMPPAESLVASLAKPT